MEKITWLQPYYHLILEQVPLNATSVLDVGAGSGIFGFILRKTRHKLFKLDAVEPFDYNLSHFTNHHIITWKEFIKRNSETLQIPIYDVLVATEVIEHMTKDDALQFLHEAKKIAFKIIIATQKEFEEQPAYDDNQYQLHHCVITKEEFDKAGYGVVEFGNSLIGIFG